MKLLRLSVAALFVLTACVYFITALSGLSRDKTYPVIKTDSDTINVSVSSDESALLEGVSAFDEKDGDISDKVIVESVSRFSERGVAVVTYAVCDGDDHVSSAKRKVIYDDYTPPRFVLKAPLVFDRAESVNILSRIGASDVFDGDISGRVIITYADYNTQISGTYQVKARVSNSFGDTIYTDLPVFIEDKGLSAPQITLRSYLLYVKVGDEVDIEGNLRSAEDNEEEDITDSVTFETDYDKTSPGLYQAHYYAEDSRGRTGHTVLIIISEE